MNDCDGDKDKWQEIMVGMKKVDKSLDDCANDSVIKKPMEMHEDDGG